MRTLITAILVLSVSSCAFKAPMVASTKGDGKYWVLTEPLEYEQPRTHQRFVVPRGFVTDLASVPRLFWTAFPPCGKYTPAAVVHDYLYWVQSPICDRECADKVLLVAMEESNVDELSRTAIFSAVRAGGQSAWDKNAEDKRSGRIRFVPEQFMNFGPNETWEQIEYRVRDAGATR